LRRRIETLRETAAIKFEKRRLEKDPITGLPRYGARTLQRVDEFVSSFRQLETNVVVEAFGETLVGEQQQGEEGDSTAAVESVLPTTQQQNVTAVNNDDNDEPALVDLLRRRAQEEEEKTLRKQRDEEERRRREERQFQEEAERAAQEERRRLDGARAAEERRRAELARRAEEEIAARDRARIEAERADRAWVAGIRKGPEGIREQPAALLRATDDDAAAQKAAIGALRALFSQIAAHPEEPKFRRIRRDHPKFNADIGRHDGGKEILIAAGFELGAIDDVPCYLSVEPNIEQDMDGWSDWFELHKAALAIIEEQLQRSSNK